MEQYIDKATVVAEIERLKKNEGWCQVGKDTADVYYARGFRFACERITSFLDTLEVKKVDLEKELNKYFITNNLIAADIQFEPVTQMKKCAKHFFELGLKTQKL